MEELIYFGHGIEIFSRDDEYFLRYDAGEIVPKLEDLKISLEQVERAKRSADDAYLVIIEATAGRQVRRG